MSDERTESADVPATLARESRRWLNQAEAADYLGVTDRTVRNYIARGTLPGHRVRGSRLVRIDRADLDALLRPIPTGGAPKWGDLLGMDPHFTCRPLPRLSAEVEVEGTVRTVETLHPPGHYRITLDVKWCPDPDTCPVLTPHGQSTGATP